MTHTMSKGSVRATLTTSEADDWAAVKFRDMIHAMYKGNLSKATLIKASIVRIIAKFNFMVEAIKAWFPKPRSGDEGNIMEGGWRRRGYGAAIFRTLEIWGFAVQFLIKEAKIRGEKDLKEQSRLRRQNGVFMKDGLLRLGPTFIKLGQLLSTRIDVLPREYTEELSVLQDKVPGFPGERAVRIIEEDFGKPISEIFESFNITSLAAASLGQVHLAKLNGELVAVKVQREGLRDLFDVDLKNLRLLAVLLDKLDPKFDGTQRDWVSIYEESARLLYKEIDYELEAANAQRFRDNFKGVPWVKVPEIKWQYVSKRVVVMEYCPGIKINDIEEISKQGIDRQLLAKRSAESYLTQLCRHGFFHCDPHPGNLACDNVEGGRLIYYDFGMMDDFTAEVRDGLVKFIFGVYENDPKEVLDAMEMVGVLQPGTDRFSVEKVARFFLDEFSKTVTTGAKWLNQMDKEEQKRIRRERRAQLGSDLLSIGNDVPFKFPPTFTFVFRAFITLDGIGKGLDETYDLTRLARPYLKELLDLKDGSVMVSTVKDILKRLGWRAEDIAAVVQSPRKVVYLENTLKKLENGDLKLRVRVLESERAFQRMELVQNNVLNVLAACVFLNLSAIVAGGTIAPALSAATRTLVAKSALALAGLFGLQVPMGMIQLRSLNKRLETFGVGR